jgi:hypothetical protein
MLQFISFRKYKYCLLASFMLIACNMKRERKIPADVLDEHRFSTILADVLLLEAHVTRNATELEGRAADVMLQHNYPMIDQKYGLSDSQLLRSYEYYLADPVALIRIMDLVQDTLNRLQIKLTAEDSTSTETDSIGY